MAVIAILCRRHQGRALRHPTSKETAAARVRLQPVCPAQWRHTTGSVGQAVSCTFRAPAKRHQRGARSAAHKGVDNAHAERDQRSRPDSARRVAWRPTSYPRTGTNQPGPPRVSRGRLEPCGGTSALAKLSRAVPSRSAPCRAQAIRAQVRAPGSLTAQRASAAQRYRLSLACRVAVMGEMIMKARPGHEGTTATSLSPLRGGGMAARHGRRPLAM